MSSRFNHRLDRNWHRRLFKSRSVGFHGERRCGSPPQVTARIHHRRVRFFSSPQSINKPYAFHTARLSIHQYRVTNSPRLALLHARPQASGHESRLEIAHLGCEQTLLQRITDFPAAKRSTSATTGNTYAARPAFYKSSEIMTRVYSRVVVKNRSGSRPEPFSARQRAINVY